MVFAKEPDCLEAGIYTGVGWQNSKRYGIFPLLPYLHFYGWTFWLFLPSDTLHHAVIFVDFQDFCFLYNCFVSLLVECRYPGSRF